MNQEYVQVRLKVTFTRVRDDLWPVEAGKTLGLCEIIALPKHEGERDPVRDTKHWKAQLRRIADRIAGELLYDGVPDLKDTGGTKDV